ncbi:ABC transporter ATP-binding protein [Vibrio quintilis]|uniref:Putative siderophore transport system ATP-binding protein YusV n=1 Tax=Vibrio quintilis TaxID=1117707 RepID=A0A1M7YYB2_9VIBR|nr:ABC transporter ATP-binding protein [Vibrio quintilis]SHO57552.1 putative siderophore transport system ATP-binding protein YusV [Vibrio quintilis]
MNMLHSSELSTRHLQLTHGTRAIVHDLSVSFPQGKVTAIVGPNGCGKSTLLNGLARVHPPASGSVYIDGKDIYSIPSGKVALKLALLPQETLAPDGITVRELVRFGRHPHQGLLRQWHSDDNTVISQALAAANLQDLSDRLLDTLSGGQRQRAWIAMCIAQETPLLLLDEPTSALDLGHQIEVFELIRTLAAQGKSIVMVVHDIAMAARYADHLIAMKDGRIIATGSPEQVITGPLLKSLYGIDCELLTDPGTGTPVLVNIQRNHSAAGHGLSDQPAA